MYESADTTIRLRVPSRSAIPARWLRCMSSMSDSEGPLSGNSTGATVVSAVLRNMKSWWKKRIC